VFFFFSFVVGGCGFLVSLSVSILFLCFVFFGVGFVPWCGCVLLLFLSVRFLGVVLGGVVVLCVALLSFGFFFMSFPLCGGLCLVGVCVDGWGGLVSGLVCLGGFFWFFGVGFFFFFCLCYMCWCGLFFVGL